MWEGVGYRTELQHIDPHSYDHNSVSFPFSCAAQPGAWGLSLSGTWYTFQLLFSNCNCSIGGLGAQPFWDMVLIPASSLQLIWGSELQLLNRGSWGPPLLGVGSLYSTLSPTDLTFLSPGLYNNLTYTYFLRASQFRTQSNPSTVNVISWYSSTGCTCYLHRCISYFDSLAESEVNIKHLD